MIKAFRDKFPMYDDMPDGELMTALYQKFYSDIPREEFDRCCGMPNHEDLGNCAVTGQDSLDLQNLDPSVKPAVKMMFDEYQGPEEGKIAFVMDDGETYIIDLSVTDPHEALTAILSGEDSELLGYPEKGDEHAAVTKQGDVVADIPEMRQHAETGNISWAANGEQQPLMEKAAKVADAINQRRLK